MQYIFKRKNPDTGEVEDEKVDLLRWVWGVTYDDDTELHQFESDGSFHQIGEIDQKRARMFTLYRSDDPSKRIDMPLSPGMKIIAKYKVVKPFYLPEAVRVYVVGFKSGPHHTFLFVLPDDRIILSNKENIDLPTYELTLPTQHGNKA